MEKIEWSDRLSIGVRKIDDQHKRLVKLVNNLVSTIQAGYGNDSLNTHLQENPLQFR